LCEVEAGKLPVNPSLDSHLPHTRYTKQGLFDYGLLIPAEELVSGDNAGGEGLRRRYNLLWFIFPLALDLLLLT
jgi:hypothetical protein